LGSELTRILYRLLNKVLRGSHRVLAPELPKSSPRDSSNSRADIFLI
jgi:hypothetical protein